MLSSYTYMTTVLFPFVQRSQGSHPTTNLYPKPPAFLFVFVCLFILLCLKGPCYGRERRKVTSDFSTKQQTGR